MEFMLLLSVGLGQIWLLSGLLTNFLQAILFWGVRPFNKNIYRKLNYYLVYANWSQIVALTEWYSGSKARIFFADDDSQRLFNQEHTICVSNHKYELDWLWAWLAADKFGILGNSKGMAKRSLRLMPVMGWCWYFSEFIFLARNWTQDSKILGKCLDQFMSYVDPVLILLFCEGTRFTQEKYDASVEFAKSKGLPVLRHHLVPRSRGFVYSIQHLAKQNKLPAVYNVQIAFANRGLIPNFVNILKGHSLVGDVYIERIPIAKVDTSSDESINQFLMNMYAKKDELMDFHNKYEKFPGRMWTPKRRLAPLINWAVWFSLIVTALYYIASVNWVSFFSVLFVLLTGVVAFLSIVRSTKAKRGSSYGASPNLSPKREAKNSKVSKDEAEDTTPTGVLENGLRNRAVKEALQNGSPPS